jgi:hypothetical protein
MKERVTIAERRRHMPSQKPQAFPDAAQPHNFRTPEDLDRKLDDILAGLDEVMDATNRVLDRYVSKRAGRLQ